MSAIEQGDPSRSPTPDQSATKSIQEWQRLLDVLPDGALVLDPRFRILAINHRLLNEIGLSREQALGKPCYRIIRHREVPCQGTHPHCPVHQAWRTGRPASALHQHETAGKLGQRSSVLATPIHDNDGKIIAMLETHRPESHPHYELAAINQLCQHLVAGKQEDQIAQAVIAVTRQIDRFSACSVWLAKRDRLWVIASEGYGFPEQDFSVPLTAPNSIAATVARSGQCLWIPDLSQDGRYLQSGKFPARSELAVPIKLDGRILGF